MVLVNDQHPFDVAPDDDRRPAADAVVPDSEQEAPEDRTATAPEPAPLDDPQSEADALAARRKHRRIAALSVAAAVIFTAGAGGGAVASLALAPNAVLLGASYLLGPGFAVGTGTVVSPGAVALGPLPAFPLLAALPAAGPTPSWLVGVLAVPVLAAFVGAVRSQRAYAVTAYDSAALRGFGGGLVAALAATVLVALAGGPMGTGRLADIGASTGEVLVAAVASMSLAGLLAGLVTAFLQRRSARRASARRASAAVAAPGSRRGAGSR